MYKYKLFFFFAVIGLFEIQAQDFKYGIKTGLNLSNFRGDNYNPKVNWIGSGDPPSPYSNERN